MLQLRMSLMMSMDSNFSRATITTSKGFFCSFAPLLWAVELNFFCCPFALGCFVAFDNA